LTNHLVELERFDNFGRFAESAKFLWQAALNWWEWAARYAAGEPDDSIKRYKVEADAVGSRFGLTMLRVARISDPDEKKDRLGALSYLVTARPFVAKQIEDKLGLQNRYLFEFGVEAQYLRSKIMPVDPAALTDLAKRSGVPETYWRSAVELSTIADRGSPELTSAVLNMNRDIASHLTERSR
jgi:hypothetical protein